MNAKKTLARAACGALLLATAGCVSVGRPFPTDRIKDIKLGKTTRADLTAAYGRPYRTGVEDGDETWTYVNERLALFGEQTTEDLYVRFNADGTVKSYSFNTNQ